MNANLARLRESSEGPYRVASLRLDEHCDPIEGRVAWDPPRSLWNGGMLIASVVLAPLYCTPGAVTMFFVLLAITMCAGHSVGFHRRLIHRTFECRKWLERLLVWCGVLVGMQGPFWVIRSHDVRDWAQRQPDCHPFLKHGGGLLLDGIWNLHCRLDLARGPKCDPGPGVADDPFYRFLQRTWMLQQLPIAAALYALGGLPWVVWGVVVRVAVGVSMRAMAWVPARSTSASSSCACSRSSVGFGACRLRRCFQCAAA
jgi:sn-1 stearoyl-lipid 9-desaturase